MQSAKWQCKCMFAVIDSGPHNSLQNFKSKPSATVMSVCDKDAWQRRVYARTNDCQHLKCSLGRISNIHITEKYSVQFFHCCAVNVEPDSICTGNQLRSEGTEMLLGRLCITFRLVLEIMLLPNQMFWVILFAVPRNKLCVGLIRSIRTGSK